MKVLIAVVFAAASLLTILLGSPSIKDTDLQPLIGGQWVGTLTYLDYGKNKKVSIPVTLNVTKSTKDQSTWIFDFRYPDEPKANNIQEVTLTDNGRTLDGETVVERIKLPGKTVKIVTEKSGQDNNKPAVLRYTYLISPKNFSIRKEVRYEGVTELFERNEYRWTR